MAQIIPPTTENLAQAGLQLREGLLVAFATETVYGLGADALNPHAVAAVFELKGRPLYDPLIVHVGSVQQARELTSTWPDIADRLATAFWPGPLTLVLPRSSVVPDLVTAGLPNVAIRWPAHPVAQALLRQADCPVAAPSANRFTRISPTTAADVNAEFPNADLWILDGGACQHGLESTVVSLVGARPAILRLGSLSLEEIEEVVGAIEVHTHSVEESEIRAGLASPGNLSRHYAPQTPLWLAEASELIEVSPDARVGLLTFGDLVPDGVLSEFTCVENLSAIGDLREAATKVYAALRRLDSVNLDKIVAVCLPDRGLGRSINDRLRRASAKREG